MILEIIKVFSLFLSLFYTIPTILKFLRREGLSSFNFAMISLGWTGFIYLQWLR